MFNNPFYERLSLSFRCRGAARRRKEDTGSTLAQKRRGVRSDFLRDREQACYLLLPQDYRPVLKRVHARVWVRVNLDPCAWAGNSLALTSSGG